MTAKAPSPEGTVHVAHAHRGTVLAVDDRPKNVKLLQITLGAEGYEVIPATSGPQALECVARKTPDVILLDVMMPEMDGFEVCKRLKQNSKTASVAVIFLSAAGDKTSIINGFEAGGVDYITKPFTKAELLARVNTHVAFKQLLDRNHSLMQARYKWVADEIENAKRPLIAIARNLEDLAVRAVTAPETMNQLIKQTLTITTCALGQFNRDEIERDLDFQAEATTEFPVTSRQVEAMISKWYLTSLRRNIGFKVSGLAHDVSANLRLSSVSYLIDLLMAAALNQSKSGDTIHARIHADTGKLQVSLEHARRVEDPRHPEPRSDAHWMDPENLDRKLLRETERLGGELRVGSGPRGKEVTVLSLPLPEGQIGPDVLESV